MVVGVGDDGEEAFHVEVGLEHIGDAVQALVPDLPGHGQSPAPAKNLLPAKYANPAKSGLTAKVIEGSNTFDFQLTD